MNIENNIFQFATKELSQDAFICWLLNWANYKDSELYNLATELLKKITGEKEISSVKIKRQYKKIDVLVIVNKKYAVIIEDKTATSEHGNQIERYRDEIAEEIKNAHKDDDLYGLSKIITVFFKTGFMYDCDLNTVADVYITVDSDKLIVAKGIGENLNRICLVDFLSKYKGNNIIMQSFIDNINRIKGMYNDCGDYSKIENIRNYSYAQYNFMREIFPIDLWINVLKNKMDSNIYMVRNGSSSGRPWTQIDIYNGKYDNSKKEDDNDNKYTLFWRIDTDSKGPYLSLRFYDKYDKNNENRKKAHIEKYNKFSNIIEDIIGNQSKDDFCITQLGINPSSKEECYEATLLHIHIKDIINNWNENERKFKKSIKLVNDILLDNIK